MQNKHLLINILSILFTMYVGVLCIPHESILHNTTQFTMYIFCHYLTLLGHVRPPTPQVLMSCDLPTDHSTFEMCGLHSRLSANSSNRVLIFKESSCHGIQRKKNCHVHYRKKHCCGQGHKQLIFLGDN